MPNETRDKEESREEDLLPEEGAGKESLTEDEETESDLERAKREARENYDKFVRAYAEFDNYKKRMERDKAEFVKYANEGLIRDLIGLLDNLDRAVDQAQKTMHAEGLVEGVEMILKQFKDTLEKYGVREIQALGEPFDPNVHEAMIHEVSEEHAENTVIDAFQKGYILKDRLLRPVMVKVAKKSGKEEESGREEQE